eukprot:scaffold86439_cov29-Tisochrysis_lutea.AAC.4
MPTATVTAFRCQMDRNTTDNRQLADNRQQYLVDCRLLIVDYLENGPDPAVSTVSGAPTGARAFYPVSTVSRRKPRYSRIYRISGSRGPYLPCRHSA